MCIRDSNQVAMQPSNPPDFSMPNTQMFQMYTNQIGQSLPTSNQTQFISIINQTIPTSNSSYTPVSYTHLDVYKRQVYAYVILCV